MDDNDYEPHERRGLFTSLKEFSQKFFSPLSLASFLVSVVIYAYQFGPPIAFGLVTLILIHEAGHAVATYYYDAEFSSPIFIPYLGAYVMVDTSNLTGWERSIVSIAGPVFGGVASAIFVFLGWHFYQGWLLFSAEIGFFMNLMNLMPLGGLDGRRICAEVHDECWIPGMIFIGGLIYTCDPDIITHFAPFLVVALLVSYGYQDPPISSSNSDRVGICGLFVLTALLLTVGDISLLHFLHSLFD